MKLIACYVQNFGTLHEREYDFHDGLNVVLEENGAGKSTLAAFIKAMFYGLSSGRGKNLEDNERKKYMPWQGGVFGGWLSFSDAQGSYRIERTFGARPAQDRLRVFDLSTQLACTRFGDQVGQAVFGVDAEVYERSIWHPQRATTFFQNAAITARLGGGQSEDLQEYTRACNALDERKRQIENAQKRGLLPNAQARLRQVQAAQSVCREKLIREQQLRVQLAGLEKEERALAQALEQTRLQAAQAARAGEDLARLEAWQLLCVRRDKAKQVLDSARAFFPNGVPEPGQLDAAEALVAQARHARALSAGAMALSDFTRLAHLTERFSQGVPQEETLRAWLEQAVHADQLRQRMGQASDEIVAQQAHIAASFCDAVPDPQSCMEMTQLLQQAFFGTAKKNTPPARIKKVDMVLLAISLMALLGGAALVFTLPIPGWSLLAGGTAAGGYAAYRLIRRWHIHKVEDRTLQAQSASARDTVEQFVSCCTDEAIKSDAPLSARLEKVTALCQRYAELEAELSALQQQQQAQQDSCRQLDAFLSSMHQEVSDSYAAAVMALSDAAAMYRALSNERDASRQRMAEASGQARTLEQQAAAFFARYGAHTSGDEEERLRAIREGMQRCDRAYQAYRDACEALMQYESGQDVSRLLSQAKPQGQDLAQLQQKEEELRMQQQEKRQQYALLCREADELSEQAEQLQQLTAEETMLTQECARLSGEYRVLEDTRTYLSQAFDALRANYLSLMQDGLRKYAALVTGMDESALQIDADFHVSAIVEGQSRDYGHFSRGQRDVFDICTRLALCDAMFSGEAVFLVLDDPFANLDDENLKRARVLLERLAAQRQILYLACHSSRA